jgi:hypothetical protein
MEGGMSGDGDDLVTSVDDEELRVGRMEFEEEATVSVNPPKLGSVDDALWKYRNINNHDLAFSGFAFNDDIERRQVSGPLEADLENSETQIPCMYHVPGRHCCGC